MPASKNLNVRIQNKFDTYANWVQNDPILLKGEIALTVIPASSNSGLQEPTLVAKIGTTGDKKWSQEQWLSGTSADVIASLKGPNPTLPASSITGLEDFISGQIQDTDTQYQVVAVGTNGFKLQSRPKSGGEWTDVGSPITITYTLVEGTANGTVKFNGTDVKVHGLGSAAYTDSTAYDSAGAADAVKTAVIGTTGDAATANTIYGAKKYADDKDTALRTSLETKISTDIGAAKTELIGTGDATSTTIKGAVDEANTYTDEQITAKISSVYKAAGSSAFDSLPTPAAGIEGNVYNVTDSFTADDKFVEGEVGKSYPAGTNVVVIKVGSVYKYDVLAGVTDLSNYATKTDVSNQISAAKTELIGTGTGVTSTTIKGAVTEAKTYADGLNTAMDTRVDALEAAVGSGGSVDSKITAAIQKLDKADTAVAGQVVSAVSETDGIITVSRRALVEDDIPELDQSKIIGLEQSLADKADDASLATIAKTGNVNDLVQTSNDYIVFNCGTSNTVI